MDVTEETEARQDGKLQLGQHLFLLRKANPSPETAASLKDSVFTAIVADSESHFALYCSRAVGNFSIALSSCLPGAFLLENISSFILNR